MLPWHSWSARFPHTEEVAGSSPVGSTGHMRPLGIHQRFKRYDAHPPLLGVASSSYANRGVPKRLRDRSAKPSFTGSTPVSASRSSTRIWVHGSVDRAPVSGAGDHGFESHWTHPCNARVVQWLEHLSYTQEVDGSSPSTSTRLRAVFGLAVSRRSCVKWVFRRTSWRHVPHVILRVCI